MASTSAGAGDVPEQAPVCIVVLGMAGSGKTTFVKMLTQHLASIGPPPYTINLDPAVYHIPYHANIDIRDTVKFKEVMKQYGFGPNGAILTSLNFFTAHFDKVINLIGKNAGKFRHVVIDTPGQIEVFTWSASGVIITELLSSTYPTIIVYVMDTPRSHSPVTFMSNMLYACSVLYRMKLPFICVLNKTDIIDCQFAIDWMRDFEAFQSALSAHRSAGAEPGADQFDSADGPGAQQDCSQYMSSLTNSLSLVLDEFYNDLSCCGVSSVTGEGFDQFMTLVAGATEQYFTVGSHPIFSPCLVDFLPALKANQKAGKDRTAPSLLSTYSEHRIYTSVCAFLLSVKHEKNLFRTLLFLFFILPPKEDTEGAVKSMSESSSSTSEEEDGQGGAGTSSRRNIAAGRKAVKNPMLVDLVGDSDNADSDPLVNLDGIEEKPHEVEEAIDGRSPLHFHGRRQDSRRSLNSPNVSI
uniref:GPN-loop GTPase 1 n=1 Tax=Schistocephalus solidus TaxID=70667 RepID=A0A183SGU5_SCHSO